jgi:hypothetical protein
MKTLTTLCLFMATTISSSTLFAADFNSTTPGLNNSVAAPPASGVSQAPDNAVVAPSSAAAAMAPSAGNINSANPNGSNTNSTTQNATVSANPTADFFIALSQCQGGEYQELNLLKESAGNQWLNQQIIGVDDQGYCQVLLQTPDGRYLHCYFDPYDIAPLADQHFLTGMIMAETKRDAKEALYAEGQWSKIKDQNCGFE